MNIFIQISKKTNTHNLRYARVHHLGLRVCSKPKPYLWAAAISNYQLLLLLLPPFVSSVPHEKTHRCPFLTNSTAVWPEHRKDHICVEVCIRSGLCSVARGTVGIGVSCSQRVEKDRERPCLLCSEVKEGSRNAKNRLICSLLFEWLLWITYYLRCYWSTDVGAIYSIILMSVFLCFF